MKRVKRIILLIAMGLFPSMLLAEGEPPLSASVSQDSDYSISISQAELKKDRLADGFKLVYSENDDCIRAIELGKPRIKQMVFVC